jgi:phosphohistidine phosphatase
MPTCRLHLLRHAKTNQSSPTGLDFDRELLPQGYEQIAELKQFLVSNPIAPKHILCSSAMRTRQTLSEIQDFWPAARIHFIDELYLASKQEILSKICALHTPDEILVVGHNEGLSELAMHLEKPAHLLQTCGFIRIEFPFETSAFISADTGQITAMFRVI